MLSILIAFGGAAAWLKHRRSARVSPFDCLSTAGTGWLTVTVDETTVHADWDPSGAHIDGVFTRSDGPPSEAEARKLAVSLISPLAGRASGGGTVGKVNIFAVCDGVTHWWSGGMPRNLGLRDCLRLSSRPLLMIACSKDWATEPPPPPGGLEAYEVARHVWTAAGKHLSEVPEMPELTGPDLQY